MSLSFSTQMNLFDSTALSGKDARDLWGALEGDDGIVPPPVAEPVHVPRMDFSLSGDRNLAGGCKARAGDTIKVIVLLVDLDQANRNATEAEQMALMKFTGFGAVKLANTLFPRGGEPFPKDWAELGEELHWVISDDDRRALAFATQSAYYTPEWIVRALWDAVMAMKFLVLEAGYGGGRFMALWPGTLEGKIAFTVFENEPVTARIARRLFPNQGIRQEEFTRADPSERYDLVIGKAKRQEDGTSPCTDLAIPFFGYKSHISIDRKFRLVRKWKGDRCDRP